MDAMTTNLATTARYAIAKFKSIWDSDFRSSCRATKGHTTQLTSTAATTPVTKAIPLDQAISLGPPSPPLARCALRETMVKLKHDIKPDRGCDESANLKTEFIISISSE